MMESSSSGSQTPDYDKITGVCAASFALYVWSVCVCVSELFETTFIRIGKLVLIRFNKVLIRFVNSLSGKVLQGPRPVLLFFLKVPHSAHF